MCRQRAAGRPARRRAACARSAGAASAYAGDSRRAGRRAGPARRGARRRARGRPWSPGAGRTRRPYGSTAASRPSAMSSPRLRAARRASARGRRSARGAEVVAAGLVRGAGRRSRSRVLASLAWMQRALSRYGSSALTRRNRGGDLGQRVQVGGQRWRRGPARPPRSRRETESSLDQRVHRPFGGTGCRARAGCSSTSRVTAGGDVRVAVAVAADPGAEGERAGGRAGLDAEPAQRRRPGRRAPAGRRRRAGRRR